MRLKWKTTLANVVSLFPALCYPALLPAENHFSPNSLHESPGIFKPLLQARQVMGRGKGAVEDIGLRRRVRDLQTCGCLLIPRQAVGNRNNASETGEQCQKAVIPMGNLIKEIGTGI